MPWGLQIGFDLVKVAVRSEQRVMLLSQGGSEPGATLRLATADAPHLEVSLRLQVSPECLVGR